MTIFEELKRRGLIAQTSGEEKIKELLEKERVTFYIGFDATADSLTAGHFLALTAMKRLQMAGHRPIVLIGGGTTMVGDPTGKTDMRKMLTMEDIAHNAGCFEKQMSKFIEFGEDKAIMVNNADWLLQLNYVQFLREVGVHFSVNRMLAFECYRSRFEGKGLSFIEFNYMLMQSYDFLKLYEDYGCIMECGGDDQWSNMIGGMELVRRIHNEEVHCMTFSLLLTSDGKKMGKTEKGALWLDPLKTSPYEFFQYWRNVKDDEVIRCMKLLTFIPIEEIEYMEGWEGAQLNRAKEILALEMTKLVHGEEEAGKADTAAKALFGDGNAAKDMPFTEICLSDFVDAKPPVLELLIQTGLAPSKGEARRLIDQGGITVNDRKVTAVTEVLSSEDFSDGFAVIKKGKKIFHKVIGK